MGGHGESHPREGHPELVFPVDDEEGKDNKSADELRGEEEKGKV